MSELQEVNVEEELSKSENEDVPVLSIQTDPLEEEEYQEPGEFQESQESQGSQGSQESQESQEPEESEEPEEPGEEELLSSLIQGSLSQSPSKVDDIQESLEEGEILEDMGQIPEDMGQIPEVDAVNSQNEQLMSQNEQQDSDEDSSDEEESIIYKNLEEDIDINILKFYHPETENINYKELLTLSKITKNKKGEIIDPFHKTLPFITQYEKAKILGQRAKQINHGSTPFVDISSNIIDGHTIALMELNQKKIPFIIRRPLPNGTSEYWKVKDLKIIL